MLPTIISMVARNRQVSSSLLTRIEASLRNLDAEVELQPDKYHKDRYYSVFLKNYYLGTVYPTQYKQSQYSIPGELRICANRVKQSIDAAYT